MCGDVRWSDASGLLGECTLTATPALKNAHTQMREYTHAFWSRTAHNTLLSWCGTCCSLMCIHAKPDGLLLLAMKTADRRALKYRLFGLPNQKKASTINGMPAGHDQGKQ